VPLINKQRSIWIRAQTSYFFLCNSYFAIRRQSKEGDNRSLSM